MIFKRAFPTLTLLLVTSTTSTSNALFFGYRPERMLERTYLIAEPEKTILDTFYLSADIRNEKDVDGLRLNFDIMAEKVSSERISTYADVFQNRRLLKLTNIITTRLNHG